MRWPLDEVSDPENGCAERVALMAQYRELRRIHVEAANELRTAVQGDRASITDCGRVLRANQAHEQAAVEAVLAESTYIRHLEDHAR